MGDNYDYIRLNDNFSYTLAVNKSAVNEIDDLDEDFIETENTEKYIYTSTAATTNYAKENLFEYIETFLQKDVFDDIIKKEQEKERSI